MKNIFMAAFVILSVNLSFGADKTTPTTQSQVIEVKVTEQGFEPSQIDVKPDTAITLKVTRKTNNTCATEIVMKEKKVKKDLPLNETVSIDLGSLKKGSHAFSCGMNMITGSITVK